MAVCNVIDAHLPGAWNCICFWFCHIVYVQFEWEILGKLWLRSPFFLTATVSWVNFGSGFCYKWMLMTWCHCTLKALKGYEKSEDVASHCTLQCLHVLLLCHSTYQVKCLELIELHFVVHNLGNHFTGIQKCVFFAFPILQRFP